MKIICTQENLKTGLATTNRIISPNNTLPILNNLLLKTENGLLKISSTNLEIAITTQIRCKIEKEGEVTVYAKAFNELINNLPNTNLTLEVQGSEMKVETDNYHTSLKTLPSEEFPLIPQIEKSNIVSINTQVFKKALESVMFAASLNQTQPEISGVMISIDKDIKMVATDRYRLAEKKELLQKNPGFEQNIILPQKTAIEISRIIGGNNEDLEISFGQNQIGFILAHTMVISRLIDGQYPDYEQIIPDEFNCNIQVERKPFINALKTGGIFSSATNSVTLSYNKDSQSLGLSSESSELGKSYVEIPAVASGEVPNLLLNFHYLLDCLNAVDAEKVNLKVINDSSPAIIVPEDNVSYRYLVMPIKN